MAVLDVGARFSGARLSPDGTRIWLVDQTGKVWSWDVGLDTRTPDAIQRITTDRDPWKLSDGGLVAVPAVLRGAAHVDDDKPFIAHEHETETATLLGQVVALFDQSDCDKIAANLRSFMVANGEQVHELVRLGWIDPASPHENRRADHEEGRDRIPCISEMSAQQGGRARTRHGEPEHPLIAIRVRSAA